MARKTKADISAEAKLEGRLMASEGAAQDLRRKYKHVLTENARLERELSALHLTRQTPKTHKIRHRKGKKSHAVAVAVLSDTHYEEEVRPSTIGGKNAYNLDIAKKRNDEFFTKVVRLIRKERQDVVIDELVLAVLGDLITGNIHDDVSMDSCLLGPMDASIFAQEMVRSGILHIREQEPHLRIRVVCKFGNHSRSTRFVHIGNEGAYATEKLIYSNLAYTFRDDNMVTFIIEDSYHTILDINGLMVRMHHGHHVKYGGGVGGVTIPLNKAIASWNSRGEFADMEILGHFHQFMFNHFDRFLINGSMIGFNTFAVAIKAKFQRPMQAFFLIDSEYGASVSIPIMFSV